MNPIAMAIMPIVGLGVGAIFWIILQYLDIDDRDAFM